MAAILSPYSITNLPEGFSYDRRTREIRCPVPHRFAMLNLDDTVSAGSGVYENVHEFVIMQIMINETYRAAKAIEKKQLSRQILLENAEIEGDKKKYVTIKSLDCTIHKDSLFMLSVFITASFIGLFLTIALCKYYL
jgi:hypothetical protein